MKTITITITNTPEEGWTVTLTEPGMSRASETRCPHLRWDEMLGQIVALTHHAIGKPHYPMLTDAEHAARDQARNARMEATQAEWRAEGEARQSAITAMADALRQWRAAEAAGDGACRVGRVVFEDHPAFNEVRGLCGEGDCTYFGQKRPGSCACSRVTA